MNKSILQEYVDACEIIKETEHDIRKLEKRKKTIIQTSVKGSNHNFPYQAKHFKIQGTPFSINYDRRLRHEEKMLEKQKLQAQEIKEKADEFLLTVTPRMQRIIRYRIFQGLKWEQVAEKMGRKATGESVRKEYERFMKKDD